MHRLRKCKWARVRRSDQPRSEPERVPKTDCMRVLEAPVHIQADSMRELDEVVALAWSAFHTKAPLGGTLRSNLRVLHFGIVSCLARASGTRHRSELQKLKALSVKMTRRIARWSPRDEEDRAAFAKRCSAWAQKQ